MKSFADTAGRTWVLSINVAAVKRCRGLVGVDLYGLIDAEFAGLGKLLSDPVQLVDVLYCLCQSQAEQLGVSDEDFGRAMAGDAIEHAADAFLAELTDFFPDARVRAGLAKVLTASRRVRDHLIVHATEAIDRLDPASIAGALRNSSGAWPASSASTPAPSRSAS